nr:16S rRNA (guanine(527)-N(7))-methyltransferase RsmG [Candidatus Gracilibacteria bacterium]
MLRQLFELYDFQFDDETISKYERFLELFKEKNSQINLSSLRDNHSIIEKHFIDSLMLTKFFNLEGKVADIGTGGGFPLLPLAILNNDAYFTGIDSVGKKLKAINEFVINLGLENVQTIHSRFEDIGNDKKYRESFDYVVSRATAYFPTLLEYAIPLLKVGGIFIAYKLDNIDEVNEGKKALEELNCKIIDTKKYSLGGQDRMLVFVKKEGNTDKKYPRNAGLPLKKPII